MECYPTAHTKMFRKRVSKSQGNERHLSHIEGISLVWTEDVGAAGLSGLFVVARARVIPARRSPMSLGSGCNPHFGTRTREDPDQFALSGWSTCFQPP